MNDKRLSENADEVRELVLQPLGELLSGGLLIEPEHSAITELVLRQASDFSSNLVHLPRQ